MPASSPSGKIQDLGNPVIIGRQARIIVEVYNQDGSFDRSFETTNGATTVGLNYENDVAYRGQSQLTTWYLGLVNNSGFSSFAASDTASSHAGWTELTSYSETTRPQWVPSASSGGVITNSSTTNFTISVSTVDVKGIFMISDNTKGGSSGTLAATGAFGAVQTFTNGQSVRVTWTITKTNV